MKKISTSLLFTVITLVSFGQSATYFHDRIDTTLYATTTGTNTYTGTNLDPNFNVKQYVRGLIVSTFIVNGNTTAATYKLVTKTGTLSTLPIKKQGGAALVSGDIPDSSAIQLLFYGSFWRLIGVHKPTDAWLLTGNSGTTAGVNFLGTTDDVALMFKVNNVQSGLINRLALNTGFGYRTLSSITSGNSNTGIGYGALDANTTGSYNTAVGQDALGANVGAGEGNTALGAQALLVNTNGDNNVAIGTNALAANTTANENTAIGYNALVNNITGKFNTAIGDQTLPTLTTGSSNTALGKHAGRLNLTGSRNVFLGDSAGVDFLGSDRFFLGNPVSPYLATADFTTGYFGIGTGTAVPVSGLDASTSVYAHSSQTVTLTGTITVGAATYTATGTGTAFLTEVKPGDVIYVNSEYRMVTKVLSNTDLYLDYSFTGAVSQANVLCFKSIATFQGSGTNDLRLAILSTPTSQYKGVYSMGDESGYAFASRSTGNTAFTWYAPSQHDARLYNDAAGIGDVLSVQDGILFLSDMTNSPNYNSYWSAAFGKGVVSRGDYGSYYVEDRSTHALSFGMYAPSPGELRFGDAANSYASPLNISQTKVGIGTTATSPTAQLHVIPAASTVAAKIDGRINGNQGADVASLNGAIAVGYDGNSFELTGTNSVTHLTSTGWQNDAEVTFAFTSTATIVDGTANSGADIGFECAGNANFVGSAGALITFKLMEIGGTQRWREKSRSVN